MHAANLAPAILETAAEAATLGNYEAVYHLLMGALHVADKQGDVDLVNELWKLGHTYQQQVDAVRPEHQLSTLASSRRGQTPLFEALQVHARAVAVRHRAESRRVV